MQRRSPGALTLTLNFSLPSYPLSLWERVRERVPQNATPNRPINFRLKHS